MQSEEAAKQKEAVKYLFVFDLDGTLAPSNKPIPHNILDVLRFLNQRPDCVLACISGKPTAYLSALFRQSGLENVYISGENGAEYALSTSYPKSIEINFAQKDLLTDIRQDLEKHFSDRIAFQCNRINTTVFADPIETTEVLDEVDAYLRTHRSCDLKKLTYFKHDDAIDIGPFGLSKARAMRTIAEQVFERPYGQCRNNVIAFGDGVNDIEMLTEAGHAYCLQKEINLPQHVRFFDTLDQALNDTLEGFDLSSETQQNHMMLSYYFNNEDFEKDVYQEVSNDWRWRDQMLYKSFGWTIGAFAILVTFLSSTNIFTNTTADIFVPIVFSFWFLIVAIKFSKDRDYQKGSDEILTLIESKNVSLMDGTPQTRSLRRVSPGADAILIKNKEKRKGLSLKERIRIRVISLSIVSWVGWIYWGIFIFSAGYSAYNARKLFEPYTVFKFFFPLC